MRTFVTGAGGFIGRRLLPALLADGHAVTALLMPDEDAKGLAHVGAVRGDITVERGLSDLVGGHDAIIHLAGAVGYGQSFERCRELNVGGTRNVARAAVESGVPRFVHMSSVAVYGRVAGVRITESFPMRKIGDPYGDTKIDAERIVGEWAARGKLRLTVVRPTVVYGPGDDKFLPKLVENLRAGRARLIGDGENRVDAIHVDDTVRFLARALVDERAVGGVYNLNNPSNPTWNELVSKVAAAIGVPAPRSRLPYVIAMALATGMELTARLRGGTPLLTRYAVRVVGRQYHYVTDRARDELGFEPRIDMREAIREAAQGGTSGGPLPVTNLPQPPPS
jgi:nucleoside-diphosphate-sugar epimerase